MIRTSVLALSLIVASTGSVAASNPSPATPNDTLPSEITIRNQTLCVKQDLTRGGTLFYLSDSNDGRNLINISDEGRYIQQSYYAGKSVDRTAEGQSKSWSPWSWNPIQAGDWGRNRAQILEYRVTDSTTYVKCIPMQWDMNNHPAEAVMEQWTRLKGNVVTVRNKLSCHRTDTLYGEGENLDQEIPAVYPISSLKHLYAYMGHIPFAQEPIDSIPVKKLIPNNPDHFWGVYPHVTEQWMAFVDSRQWGLGVYSPSATKFLAGQFGDDLQGDSYSGSTSYIAPTRKERLMKNSVMEYEYHLIVGPLSEIRLAVYRLHKARQHRER